MANLNEATMFQKYWLHLMAVNDIQFKLSIENKLIGIAKGVGVEFKNDSNSVRQSMGFREQMKRKQEENRKKRNGGELNNE